MRRTAPYLFIVLLTSWSALALGEVAPRDLAQCMHATFRLPFRTTSGFPVSTTGVREIPNGSAVSLFSQDDFYSIKDNRFYKSRAVANGDGAYFLVDPSLPLGKHIWGSGRAVSGEAGARIIANTADTRAYSRIAPSDLVNDPRVVQHATDLYVHELKSRLLSLRSGLRVFGNSEKWTSEDWTTTGNLESLGAGLCGCVAVLPELIEAVKRELVETSLVEDDDGHVRSLEQKDLLCVGETS